MKTPPQPFLGSILIRTVLVWATFRAVAAAAIGSVPASGGDVGAHPVTGVGITAAVILVVTLDLYRRDEVTFLRALGVGRVGMVLPSILLCGALEATLLLVA